MELEYRYHRMAANENSWILPSAGRLRQTKDYVGEHGYGFEDWNFSGDKWSDGKLHLYLQQPPAKANRAEAFSIILGYRKKDGAHYAVGLCRNARYVDGDAQLSEEALLRRARQLQELDDLGQLAGPLQGIPVKAKAAGLRESSAEFWIAVDPVNLIQFDQAILIPEDIVAPNNHRYKLNKLTRHDFERIKLLVSLSRAPEEPEVQLFAEGRLVARSHLNRERNPEVVAVAKSCFKKRHGSLHCEACHWPQNSPFETTEAMSDTIEAHHVIPLSSVAYTGQTSPEDLRMLCPTCHRAIHRLRPEMNVEEFKERYFPG